jgi:nucleoid-associated protein YgaU
MLRNLALITLLLALVACAKPPLQELAAAEQLLSRARSLQAQEWAPSEFQAAEKALDDARQATDATDYSDARESLEYAFKHARRATVIAEEELARQRAEEQARRAAEKLAREAALARAAEAKAAQQMKQAAALKVDKPKPKAKPVKVKSYKVGEGETLWTISAQPQVYDEGLLWPLLYQANRDQIKDPRQIFPGQSLSVRRDMTEQELAEARQKARESDIFPVPRAPDQAQ